MTTISHNKLYVNKSELIYKPLCFHKKNLMQTATGYGLKLKTEYMYKYTGLLKEIKTKEIMNYIIEINLLLVLHGY